MSLNAEACWYYRGAGPVNVLSAKLFPSSAKLDFIGNIL